MTAQIPKGIFAAQHGKHGSNASIEPVMAMPKDLMRSSATAPMITPVEIAMTRKVYPTTT